MIRAAAPDANALAPFAALIGPPATAGGRAMYHPLLPPVAGLELQFHTNCIEPAGPLCALDGVERHPHAAQAFLPLDVSRYLVTVMPTLPDGGPDAARARAFVLPGNRGVIYRPGAWHAGITVLDAPGSFAVLMWRGAPDDDQFADIAPLTIDIPPLLR